MKFISIILLLLASYFSMAQNTQDESTWWIVSSSVNPAFVGIENGMNTAFITNNQMAGFEGSPKNSTFNFSLRPKRLRGGIGITHRNNTLGPIIQRSTSMNYAYSRNWGDNVLSFGLSAGILRAKIINSSDDDASVFDYKVGLAYQRNNLKIGTSVHRNQNGNALLYWLNPLWNGRQTVSITTLEYKININKSTILITRSLLNISAPPCIYECFNGSQLQGKILVKYWDNKSY